MASLHLKNSIKTPRDYGFLFRRLTSCCGRCGPKLQGLFCIALECNVRSRSSASLGHDKSVGKGKGRESCQEF